MKKTSHTFYFVLAIIIAIVLGVLFIYKTYQQPSDIETSDNSSATMPPKSSIPSGVAPSVPPATVQ